MGQKNDQNSVGEQSREVHNLKKEGEHGETLLSRTHDPLYKHVR